MAVVSIARNTYRVQLAVDCPGVREIIVVADVFYVDDNGTLILAVKPDTPTTAFAAGSWEYITKEPHTS